MIYGDITSQTYKIRMYYDIKCYERLLGIAKLTILFVCMYTYQKGTIHLVKLLKQIMS